MPYFAVFYTYTNDTAAREAGLQEHRAFLRGLASEGVLVASGPLVGTAPVRALLLFRAEGAAAVQEALQADPFQQSGLVAETSVVEWNPVIGVFADEPG